MFGIPKVLLQPIVIDGASLLRFVKFFLQPIYIDGGTYIGIAVFGFLCTEFGTDEARKFISEGLLFWLKLFCGAMSAGLLALKMYRSTAFADHKNSQGNTSQFTKPPGS